MLSKLFLKKIFFFSHKFVEIYFLLNNTADMLSWSNAYYLIGFYKIIFQHKLPCRYSLSW